MRTATILAVGCVSVPAEGPSASIVSSLPTYESPAIPATDAAQSPQGPAGEASQEALAKKLANPIAALISVPFQLNHDEDIGPGDGERWTLNVQPVVPISLNADWNVISRTILPLIAQDDIAAGDDESGTGDVVQSLFFSPIAPTERGWIWGAGPVFLPDCERRDAGRRAVGHRADRRGPETGRPVDLRGARESHLVVRGR